MSEQREDSSAVRIDPDYKDPDLLPSQMRIKSLADEMLVFKPSELAASAFFDLQGVNPKKILDRIRGTSLANMLLGEDNPLSDDGALEYNSRIGLFANDENLTRVRLMAHGWEYDKRRPDPKGPQQIPFDVLEFPGEKDWGRSVTVSFIYGTKKRYAVQSISSTAGSQEFGELPSFSRKAYSPDFQEEMGISGHSDITRSFENEEEANFYYDLVEELFEDWKKENPDSVHGTKPKDLPDDSDKEIAQFLDALE